jgi:hypothetical protein
MAESESEWSREGRRGGKCEGGSWAWFAWPALAVACAVPDAWARTDTGWARPSVVGVEPNRTAVTGSATDGYHHHSTAGRTSVVRCAVEFFSGAAGTITMDREGPTVDGGAPLFHRRLLVFLSIQF